MLDLTDTRWAGLDAFIGDSARLPGEIREFSRVSGTPDETDAWVRVRDYFLHQGTVKNATAQAVIPHVVGAVARMTDNSRVDAIVDIGIAEGARLSRAGPKLDPALFPDSYRQAISDVLSLALALVSVTRDAQTFRYLMSAIAFLSGHHPFGTILFTLDGLSGKCPNCKTVVDPDGLAGSEYT